MEFGWLNRLFDQRFKSRDTNGEISMLLTSIHAFPASEQVGRMRNEFSIFLSVVPKARKLSIDECIISEEVHGLVHTSSSPIPSREYVYRARRYLLKCGKEKYLDLVLPPNP